MAPVGGVPSIVRVVDSIKETGLPYCVVAAEELQRAKAVPNLVPERGSQMMNARAGAETLGVRNVIFCACDAPLVKPEDYVRLISDCEFAFLGRSMWFAAPLCDADEFRRHYPCFKSSHLRFAEGKMMTGGLYACSMQGFDRCQAIFASFSESRKSQIGIATRVGLLVAVPYMLGWLTIRKTEATATRLLGGSARLFTGYSTRIAVDFDTLDQYRCVNSVLSS